jgi:hypothetical protein
MKRAVGVTLLFVLAGCTGGFTAPETPTLIGQSPTITVTPSVETSPSPVDARPAESPRRQGNHGEVVATLPGIGTLAWDCRRKAGSLDFKFSTTFTAEDGIQTVRYSLDGGPWVFNSKVLEPGDVISTPFRSATSHEWRVVQRSKPYTTKATFVATLAGSSFGECLNPDVQVSRVRVSHMPA